MKYVLTILFVAAAVVPACKSHKANERDVKAAAPDAKAELYISPDDHRYVEGGRNREIIYYSQRQEKTFVVDEESGRILKTYEGTMPEVEVMEEPTGCGEEEMKKSGCGN